MLRILKYSYSLADLHYNQDSLPIITPFFQKKADNARTFFDFEHPGTLTLMQQMLPKTKQHEHLIQLYLNFIKAGNKKPEGLAYHYLEGNLRKKIVDNLHKQKIKVLDTKLTMLRSQLIDHTIFVGVFIDRKYNLNLQSYSFTEKRPGNFIYEVKPILRKEAAQLYDVITRQYYNKDMKSVYGVEISTFIQKHPVNRYLFEMILDLEMTVERRGTIQKIGGQGPTKHILQIESFYQFYSSIEQFYLTDVDFILKGNPFFREKPKL